MEAHWLPWALQDTLAVSTITLADGAGSLTSLASIPKHSR